MTEFVLIHSFKGSSIARHLVTSPMVRGSNLIIVIMVISKLHFDMYKLNIKIRISVMVGNLYSAGLIAGISSEKKRK